MKSGNWNRIRVVVGDITTLEVDAIVNAAKSTLLGGGGVDGAIHRAAGPELAEYCSKLNGCPTGQSKITPGFRIKASHIIHTVGPIWSGGQSGEPEALRSCYRSSLTLAKEYQLKTIGFPCISTGIYGYPKTEASSTAIDVVSKWLGENSFPEIVHFCCFDSNDFKLYQAELTAKI